MRIQAASRTTKRQDRAGGGRSVAGPGDAALGAEGVCTALLLDPVVTHPLSGLAAAHDYTSSTLHFRSRGLGGMARPPVATAPSGIVDGAASGLCLYVLPQS